MYKDALDPIKNLEGVYNTVSGNHIPYMLNVQPYTVVSSVASGREFHYTHGFSAIDDCEYIFLNCSDELVEKILENHAAITGAVTEPYGKWSFTVREADEQVKVEYEIVAVDPSINKQLTKHLCPMNMQLDFKKYCQVIIKGHSCSLIDFLNKSKSGIL